MSDKLTSVEIEGIDYKAPQEVRPMGTNQHPAYKQRERDRNHAMTRAVDRLAGRVKG